MRIVDGFVDRETGLFGSRSYKCLNSIFELERSSIHGNYNDSRDDA